jgi:hypothetical protein
MEEVALHLVEKYLKAREQLLWLRSRRKAKERADRDALVEEMDLLWFAMTDEERKELDAAVAQR